MRKDIKDHNSFPAGAYVVLLASCDGINSWSSSIPINHCYKLRAESSTFCFAICKDITGSTSNGWQGVNKSTKHNKLKLRLATQLEAHEYQRLDKPFPISNLSINQIINNYEIF